MKRTISMILAILMLLPLIASMAIAVSPDDIVVTDTPQNIANVAEFSVKEECGLPWAGWETDYLVDGDKETGTYSPQGRTATFIVDFSKNFYISNVIFTVNGKGELDGEELEEVLYDTASVSIVAYNEKGKLVYESTEPVDTRELEEITVAVGNDVKTMEITVVPTNTSNGSNSYCSLWELEAYTVNPPVRCDAEQENIASTALLNSTVYNAAEEENVPSSWWAMDLSRMIDGDIHTGTHTVKSGAFSLWFYFGQEKRISEIVVHCNGNGALSSATGLHTKDFEVNGQKVGEGINYFNAYEIKVVLYDYNDEVVYESELTDVSALTELSAQAGVDATTVELKISNAGAAGQGGAIYIWDVDIFEETGEHVYEQISQEAPRCGIPGYRQYQCQDPSCQMTRLETLQPTGYHTWDDGAISNDPAETANGTKVLTCQECGQTVNRDVPALGHNWDAGTVIAPSCVDGYTEYKCNDKDCTLSYKDNFVLGIGHKYDKGVTTKRATTETEGELLFTCQREGCGYKHTKILRCAKYIDSTFKVDNSIVVDYIGSANDELAEYIFDGNTTDGKYWCGPGVRNVQKDEEGNVIKDENGQEVEIRNSSTLTLVLDKDYYFTKGLLYVYSNWNWMEVHFMYQNDAGEWKTSATFRHDRIDTQGAIKVVDMTSSLNQGARATKIVIEAVSAKNLWNVETPGSGLQFHEIELEAHKCSFTPDDYEPKENWKMPTCSAPGSCKATCTVCGAVSTVVLDSKTYAHNCGEVTVVKEPTCLLDGIGEKTCLDCSETLEVVVPATGEHSYSKDSVFIAPQCSKVGVGQKVCEKCGDVSYQYPIDATGEHKDDWVTKSQANYTAIGVDRYACIYCGRQGNEEDIITDKLAIPENFITFRGYSIRMTDYVGIRASFQFDQAILEELEKTCDVTITIYAKDVATGKVVSAQAYGKQVYYSNTKKYNENNEFSAVAKVTDCKAEYEFSYEVKLVNFRGTEIKTVVVPGYTNGKTTTNVKELANDAIKASTINSDVKKFLQEVIAE